MRIQDYGLRIAINLKSIILNSQSIIDKHATNPI